uniref:Uncharacterized protein n=1 Tax=Vitis vinifera TaxID=29760 RepID=F6HQP0_VITVI
MEYNKWSILICSVAEKARLRQIGLWAELGALRASY